MFLLLGSKFLECGLQLQNSLVHGVDLLGEVRQTFLEIPLLLQNLFRDCVRVVALKLSLNNFSFNRNIVPESFSSSLIWARIFLEENVSCLRNQRSVRLVAMLISSYWMCSPPNSPRSLENILSSPSTNSTCIESFFSSAFSAIDWMSSTARPVRRFMMMMDMMITKQKKRKPV